MVMSPILATLAKREGTLALTWGEKNKMQAQQRQIWDCPRGVLTRQLTSEDQARLDEGRRSLNFSTATRPSVEKLSFGQSSCLTFT